MAAGRRLKKVMIRPLPRDGKPPVRPAGKARPTAEQDEVEEPSEDEDQDQDDARDQQPKVVAGEATSDPSSVASTLAALAARIAALSAQRTELLRSRLAELDVEIEKAKRRVVDLQAERTELAREAGQKKAVTAPTPAKAEPRSETPGALSETRILDACDVDGKSLAELAAALGVPTETLTPTVKAMVRAGTLATSGQRRGTRYHVPE